MGQPVLGLYHLYIGCPEEGKGGGVILYIAEKLKGVMCPDMDVGFEEAVWCKIKLSSEYLLVGVCYRSPYSSDSNNQSLLDMLDEAVKVPHVEHLHLLIMGDFNCPKINYTSGCF